MRIEDFNRGCDLLPEGVSWGDNITPELAMHIADAALRAQADAQPVGFIEQWELDQLKTGCVARVFPTKDEPHDVAVFTHPEASAPGLSEREIADTVNKVRDIAREFHATQQLRERIARVLVPILTRASAATVGGPKPVYDCSTRNCQCDACRIERGETGPFNDDEGRTELEASQQHAESRKFEVSEEWLSKRLAIADDADCAAGQPKQKRPCDSPPGCNGNNCLGCGEQQAEPTNAELAQAFAYLDQRVIALEQAEPGADEPPLGGRWHHGNGVVVCGTLRIFGEDFDTDPAQDFKESILTWVCDTLNAAQAAYRAAQSGQRAGVAEDVGVLKLNPLTPYGMLVRALRIVANANLAEMAAYVGKSAAHLSAMEFGRKEVSTKDFLDASNFFYSNGITHTSPALDIARTARTEFAAAPTQQQEGGK